MEIFPAIAFQKARPQRVNAARTYLVIFDYYCIFRKCQQKNDPISPQKRQVPQKVLDKPVGSGYTVNVKRMRCELAAQQDHCFGSDAAS